MVVLFVPIVVPPCLPRAAARGGRINLKKSTNPRTYAEARAAVLMPYFSHSIQWKTLLRRDADLLMLVATQSRVLRGDYSDSTTNST